MIILLLQSMTLILEIMYSTLTEFYQVIYKYKKLQQFIIQIPHYYMHDLDTLVLLYLIDRILELFLKRYNFVPYVLLLNWLDRRKEKLLIGILPYVLKEDIHLM